MTTDNLALVSNVLFWVAIVVGIPAAILWVLLAIIAIFRENLYKPIWMLLLFAAGAMVLALLLHPAIAG